MAKDEDGFLIQSEDRVRVSMTDVRSIGEPESDTNPDRHALMTDAAGDMDAMDSADVDHSSDLVAKFKFPGDATIRFLSDDDPLRPYRIQMNCTPSGPWVPEVGQHFMMKFKNGDRSWQTEVFVVMSREPHAVFAQSLGGYWANDLRVFIAEEVQFFPVSPTTIALVQAEQRRKNNS